MPAPSTGRDLHIDQPLSNVVVGRRPAGFIADRVLPVTSVPKQSDVYFKFRHKESYRYEAGRSVRAPGSRPRKVAMTVTSDTFYCKNYALSDELVVEDIVNADAVLQWSETRALNLTDNLLTDYEMRIAALAVNTTNVATVTSINTAWSNISGSQPLTDMLAFKENFRQLAGVLPNRIIIPQQVMAKLQLSDQLRDILYGDRGGMVTAQQIANLIGVEEALVPYSQVNTFGEQETINASASFADIWGSHFWMMKVELLSGMYTDTWANAFRWTSPLLGTPWAVQRFPYDEKTRKFEMDVGYYQDEKIVSSDLAIRVQSVI